MDTLGVTEKDGVIETDGVGLKGTMYLKLLLYNLWIIQEFSCMILGWMSTLIILVR